MENYKHIPVEFRGFGLTFEVYYTTTEYNFSDEVQGVTIDFDYHGFTIEGAYVISARLAKAILAEHYDSISEQLADGDVMQLPDLKKETIEQHIDFAWDTFTLEASVHIIR